MVEGMEISKQLHNINSKLFPCLILFNMNEHEEFEQTSCLFYIISFVYITGPEPVWCTWRWWQKWRERWQGLIKIIVFI